MGAKASLFDSIDRLLGNEARSERRRARIIRACKREILYSAQIDWCEIAYLVGQGIKKVLLPMIITLIMVSV